MAGFNETPGSNRLHIGFFGKTNSGKSSILNALTGHEVSIVADVKGTTTDVVYKSMEIYPLGACVLMDTAGFDDESKLGERRLQKTKLAAEKADIAVIVIAGEEITNMDSNQSFESNFPIENDWYQYFKERKTPVLFVINKIDLLEDNYEYKEMLQAGKDKMVHMVSAKTGRGIKELATVLARFIPESFGEESITGKLVSEDDVVLLVMPQDIQAPKGRLILPQVQTIRELLDKKCIVISVTTDKMLPAIQSLHKPPKLIITDSQVFDYVYENKPKDSMLTSFSILFAAYKGDISYYVQSVQTIEKLTEKSKVLIAECCTHAPLSEDIGRVKIPNMLKKRIGEGLTIDIVSGTDFPLDLTGYDIVIQCGGCMFHRKYVMSRIACAKKDKVPMTNYGVLLAYLTGILERIQY